MAVKIPTRLSIYSKIRLICLAIFLPTLFQQEEASDSLRLEGRQNANSDRVQMVRSSYLQSFIFVLSAVLVGWAIAFFVQFFCTQSKVWVTSFAVIGTALLLWATVAVRGWEVASFSTVTFGERLNVWIFRSLYWVGTACLIAAIFLG